ncbi:hypothetical protein [Pilimelia anulata]|nr:hypothetical protein [Pilimelia anulata]
MVALGVVATVLAPITVFLVSSLGQTRESGSRQVAAQVAAAALEAARGSGGARLLPGTPPTATIGTIAYGVSGTAASATYTRVEPERVSGVAYAERWLVTPCWQATPGAACATAPATGSHLVRVQVTVEWADPVCGDRPCTHTAATLVSADTTEPTFPT